MNDSSARKRFGELLQFHVQSDIRPRGVRPVAVRQRAADFARKLEVSGVQLRNYFQGKNLPRKLDRILDLLFADDIDKSDSRSALLEAWQAAQGMAPERPLWRGSFAGLTAEETALVWVVLHATEPVTLPWLQGVFGQDAQVIRRSLIAKYVLADEAIHTLPEEAHDAAHVHLIDIIADEVQREQPKLIALIPLIDTRESEDAIRARWTRLIGGVGEALHGRGFSAATIVTRLHAMIERIRGAGDETYLAGNLVNLLHESREALSEVDLSQLTIRHAYLRSAIMQGATLAGSHLVDCVLADTFGSIWQVGFRADGAEVLASSVTGQVRAWEVDTWTTLRIYGGSRDGHHGWSFGFATSPGEVASAGGDGEIRVWHESGALDARLEGHISRVRGVAFLPDKSIVSCSEDKVIYRWTRTFGGSRRVELYRHQDRAATLAVEPLGTMIASGAGDGEIVFCPADEPGRLIRRREHRKEVRCVRFSADGTSLISVSDDGRALLWDVREARVREALKAIGNCKAACFLGDSNDTVLLGDDEGGISLWRAPDERLVFRWSAHSSLVRSVASSPDGRLVASGGDDQTLHIWRYEGDDARRPVLLRSHSGYLSQVRALAFAPSGELASAHDDGLIRLWDPRSGAARLARPIKAHQGRIWSLAFWQSGELLISAGEDGLVHVWRRGRDRPERSWRGHDYRVFAVAARDVSSPLVASGGSDKTVRFWQLDCETPVQTIHSAEGHTRRVRDVSFSPDGATLASVGEDGCVILWQEQGGNWSEAARRSEDRPVTSVRFTPAGSVVYVTDAGELVIWSVGQDRVRRRKLCDRPLITVTIDPHGAIALAGSEDGQIYPIELASMEPGAALAAHQDWVEQVLFSPDGSIFASASDDQFIGVYDSLTRARLVDRFKASLPYQGLRIDGLTGISAADRAKLLALGALEDVHPAHHKGNP